MKPSEWIKKVMIKRDCDTASAIVAYLDREAEQADTSGKGYFGTLADVMSNEANKPPSGEPREGCCEKCEYRTPLGGMLIKQVCENRFCPCHQPTTSTESDTRKSQCNDCYDGDHIQCSGGKCECACRKPAKDVGEWEVELASEGTLLAAFQKERTEAITEMFNNKYADGIYPTSRLFARLDKCVADLLERVREEGDQALMRLVARLRGDLFATPRKYNWDTLNDILSERLAEELAARSRKEVGSE